MRLFGVPQDSPCLFTNKGNLPALGKPNRGVCFIPTEITTTGVPTYRISDGYNHLILYAENGSLKSDHGTLYRHQGMDLWLVVPRLSESNYGGNGCNGFDIVHYLTGMRLEVKNG